MALGKVNGNNSLRTVTKSAELVGGGSKIHTLPILDFGKEIEFASAYVFGVVQKFDAGAYMYLTLNTTIQGSNDNLNWITIEYFATSQSSNYKAQGFICNDKKVRFRYYRCMIDFGTSETQSKVYRSAGFTVTCKK
ncbi:hypothetical protein [Anaerorhabdus sp.]|uniref:hypothetical protein n=1 Tax=Anaerorhabdus sp. TaxID=1872524 RepID=UPI002FC6A64F